MNTIITWFGNHPTVVIVTIICVAIMVISAMYFHYDLSFIPDLLKNAL